MEEKQNKILEAQAEKEKVSEKPAAEASAKPEVPPKKGATTSNISYLPYLI